MKYYYELLVKVYLLQDVKKEQCGCSLGRYINFSMQKDDMLKKLHLNSNLKHYCFSHLYPIEKDKVYKRNQIYQFRLRTSDADLFIRFQKVLSDLRNDTFITLTVEPFEKSRNKTIHAISTITPVITTIRTEDKLRCYCNEKDGEEYAKAAILDNLTHKYNKLNNIIINTKFETIFEEIKEQKVYIPIMYKDILFLGYKYNMYFKSNELAQTFATIALAEGIGEKNSACGAGFGWILYK